MKDWKDQRNLDCSQTFFLFWTIWWARENDHEAREKTKKETERKKEEENNFFSLSPFPTPTPTCLRSPVGSIFIRARRSLKRKWRVCEQEKGNQTLPGRSHKGHKAYIQYRQKEQETKYVSMMHECECLYKVCTIRSWLNREFKLYVYGKRQTSDSSWEFLKIEKLGRQKQLKTILMDNKLR